MASIASAKDREPQIRSVILRNGPDQVAHPIYVAGEVATVPQLWKKYAQRS
ncbi:hypothetical protein [Hyalangium minutum]|uniref:Uncharacterized protein n=1 Tax=Hyalangium minutum TaxID=394096 RepID=A0A085WWS2_9BACT|nr:hypothetical protein [Hyalangium minutum]KFE72135.1 hypothetical protein DB31_0396 [Hyalangium minutum]